MSAVFSPYKLCAGHQSDGLGDNMNGMYVPKGMVGWVPRKIRQLGEHGANALKPTITNGRYMGPMISRQVAAKLRKRALIEGTYGEFNPLYGGWLPEWDNVRKTYALRPEKGHLRDRNRAERAEKITKAMKGMPERIERYEKEVEDRKPKKDLSFIFKRVKKVSAKKNKKVLQQGSTGNSKDKSGKK